MKNMPWHGLKFFYHEIELTKSKLKTTWFGVSRIEQPWVTSEGEKEQREAAIVLNQALVGDNYLQNKWRKTICKRHFQIKQFNEKSVDIGQYILDG